jgi:hypothetical protein
VKQFSFNIYLRFHHPEIDPAAISAEMGFEPGRMWRAGDLKMTAAGRPLVGVREKTYWTARVVDEPDPEGYPIDALERLAARFFPHKPFFDKIRAEGGQVEFYLNWNVDRNCGDQISPELMGSLADLGVTLSLDIYPPDTNTDVIPGECER